MRDGDLIRLDTEAGTLEAKVAPEEWAQRVPSTADLSRNQFGMGRELFQSARAVALTAEEGAGTFGSIIEQRPANVLEDEPSMTQPPPLKKGE